MTYLRRVGNQGVDQQLHSQLERSILSLVHELLQAVSVARSLHISQSKEAQSKLVSYLSRQSRLELG